MPRVSIILPLYNGAAYIADTLRSIAAQTVADAELIVVNDGSTDASPALVERLCGESSSPTLQSLRLITQVNQGVATARNRGIAAANAPWLAFIDQDDLWLPDKLARQLDALRNRPDARWCYSAFVRFYATGREVPKQDGADDRRTTWQRLLDGSLFIPPAAALVARDACDAVRGFDAAFIPSDDWDFFLKLCEQFECCYCGEMLTRFRSHRASTGKRQRRRIFEAQRAVLERHRGRAREVVSPAVLQRREATILWHLGREADAAGEHAAARQLYRDAVQLHPWRTKLVRSWLAACLRL